MSHTLVDSTGFANTLSESTLSDVTIASIHTALHNAKLSVKEDVAGQKFLVHHDGAYVSVNVQDNAIKLSKNANTAIVPVTSSRLDDDFIMAFRYIWAAQ